MSTERSVRNRLRSVLETAAGFNVASADDLIARIEAEGNPAFLRRTYDRDADEARAVMSRSSIAAAVSLCRSMGLLDESGSLTDAGRPGAWGDNFDRIVCTGVGRAFAAAGLTSSALDDAARALLGEDPPRLPTAPTLWLELKPNMALDEFARYLSLLAQADGAIASQRKIYLRIGQWLDGR